MRLAGLDLSTKRIGYASPLGTVFSIEARAGADDPARRLHELVAGIADLIRYYPPAPELVIIEGYSLASPGRLALVRLGEIGGVARLRLFELGIAYREVPPSSLKRHATGNGNADKTKMLERAIELGAPVTNHDEADAWLLRRMGRQAHGLEPAELAHEQDAIASAGIAW